MFNELKSLILPDRSNIARRVPSGNDGGLKLVLMILGVILLFTDYWIVGLMLLGLATIISKGHYECGACGHAVSARSQWCRICRANLVSRVPSRLDPRPWFVRPLFLNLVILCLTMAAVFLVLWFNLKTAVERLGE